MKIKLTGASEAFYGQFSRHLEPEAKDTIADALLAVSSMSSAQAAAQLNVSMKTLQNYSRMHDIDRWPGKKIAGLRQKVDFALREMDSFRRNFSGKSL